jgi:hypothetical protein
MTQFLSGISVVLLGAIGWFALEFVGRPIRSFFDLRRETGRQMFFLANVAPVEFVDDHIRAADPAHQRSIAAVQNVEKTFRDLGTQLLAFGESEWPASRLVKLAGFDATAAGNALIGFSNNANVYGAEKAEFRRRVGQALRFKN